MLNVVIYVMLEFNIYSISIQWQSSSIPRRFLFNNKFQFKENSPSVHCENSIKFFAIESHWHSKFQRYSDVIGLLLSWRKIFPLKRCFVIFVAFGKNVVCPDKHYPANSASRVDKHIFSSPNEIPKSMYTQTFKLIWILFHNGLSVVRSS